mmetsp:Transcript_4505/g.10316  ORF Transcript_4505/g.10316 Transcript_4505/m.10316 type:complete len:291 (-) Transcript_4505:145-1017(-)
MPLGFDLSPPGMSPVAPDGFINASSQNAEDGFIYGRAPRPPAEPPNLPELFEAAGIPEGKEKGGLPHTLEWYRGAKDRQAARDKESDELLMKKNELRKQWNEEMWNTLGDMQAKVDAIFNEPQPRGALAELLARVAHERPTYVEKVDVLRVRVEEAEREKVRLNGLMSSARNSLENIEVAIRQRHQEGDAEEVERLRVKEEERKKKAKQDRVLKRMQALLQGVELPPTPPDGEEPEPAEAQPRAPSPGLLNSTPGDPFGTAVPPEPGAVRGGLSRELPPIVDRPLPPSLH